MKSFLRLVTVLSAVSVAGCLAPAGYHYNLGSFTPTPNDPCQASFVNGPGMLSWINSTIGKPRGVREAVVSISGSADAGMGDPIALGLPVPGGSQAVVACYATVHYQDGTAEDGLLDISNPNGGMPLRVVWIDRADVERARVTREQQIQHDQQQSIAYSAYLQACTLEWKVAIEAKSLLSSGESQDAIEDDLVNRHAYGPDGQVYRGSEDVAAMIHQVVAAVAMPADLRSRNHIPDYASQLFLADCPAKARQSVEAAGNGEGR